MKTSLQRIDGGRLVLQQLRSGDPASPRIVCFPSVGGGPIGFHALVERLPDDWNVWALDLPGHIRTTGDTLTSVDEIVAECLRLLPTELISGSFLVGADLGGYVAHALAAELERMGRTVPGVVIAGATPISVRNRTAPLSQEDDDTVFRALLCGGKDPRAEISDTRRVLFEVFKGIIRADLEASDTYQPTARIDAPVLVIGGADDPFCATTELAAWGEHTTDPEIEVVAGGHFIVSRSADAVAMLASTFIARQSMTVTSEIRAVSDFRSIADVADAEADSEQVVVRLIA